MADLSLYFTYRADGDKVGFENPFFAPALTLEGVPSVYTVQVDAAGTAAVWSGAPLGATFDVAAFYCNTDAHLQFTVNGGEADESHFTLFVRGGGFPTILQGGQAYTGQTGAEDAFTEGSLENITAITVLNADADIDGVLHVLLGKAATA